MTEAEIIQKISSKRDELEEKKAKDASSEVITAIEEEIAKLSSSLTSAEENRGKQIFLDECAG